jgi:hypothetical protein
MLGEEDPMLESSLYPRIGRFLENRGWRVEYEVHPRPGSPRSFDVVGVKVRLGEVAVVEAKVDGFRRAMEQALNRLFVADLVYLSFPDPYARRALREYTSEVTTAGIGLLGVDGRVRELVPARPSPLVNPERRAELIGMVKQPGANHG